MPFYINRNFENQLYEYLASIQAWLNTRPINLGGASGPSGGFGWGFIGQLPQSSIAFDTSEAAVWEIPASGWSLLHNLNRIRYMIAGSLQEVQQNDTPVASGISIINFEGNVSVLKEANKVTVTIASGVSAGNTVVSEQTFSQAPASGTSVLYSRVDHTHGTPYQPTREIIFTMPYDLVTTVGGLRMYNQLGINFHISKVLISVATPPVTSDDVTVDINNGGTTIFSTQANRPVITSGNYTGSTTTINLPDFNDGDYLTMDIDIPGSGTSFLTAHVVLVDTSL